MPMASPIGTVIKIKDMVHKFSVSFYVRSNYSNRDGMEPVISRINLDGKRLSIGSTGVEVKPGHWNGLIGRVCGNDEQAARSNAELDRIAHSLYSVYYQIGEHHQITIGDIKSQYKRCDGAITTVKELFEKFNSFKFNGQNGKTSKTTKDKYILAERRFLEMLRSKYGKDDIGLCRLSPVIIEDYFHYLMESIGQNNNTACKTLKTFRGIVLFGIRLGVLVCDPYLGIIHRMVPVNRTYLTDRELRAIISKRFTTKRLGQVRDVFVFACYTGMYFCEISRLKDDDVVESCDKKWINTHRKKNGQPVFVPLLDKPLKLIRKYRRLRRAKDGDKLFPLSSSEKTNQYLKEIAAVCGINKNLTFRVARYTFATLALINGVPEETIAVMLGHSSTRYTHIYARMTNKKVLDDMKEYGDKLKKLGL